MRWKEALLKECNRARIRGGEVRINFIRRQDKAIPVIKTYIDNHIRCEEETIVIDD